jgi:hypothetical protein
MPAALAAVIDELERLGFAVARRAEPCAPDIWWERET